MSTSARTGRASAVALQPPASAALRRLANALGADIRTLATIALDVLRARHAGTGEQQEHDASFVEWVRRRGTAPGGEWLPRADGIEVGARDDGDRVVLEIASSGAAENVHVVLDQLPFLLTQLAELPDVPVGAHSLVTSSTGRLLPDPATPLERHERERAADTFLGCAARLPDLPAISESGRDWSYGVLAARVAEIASQLRAAGLKPSDVVAVTGRRNGDLIAALLGVLAAPCVLLTVDPALPSDRRRMMVAHAAPRAVLSTSDPFDDGWSRDLKVPIGRVGDAIQVAPAVTTHASKLAATGGDAAYIFFTSGSTGTPKAVLGSHNGLSHFLAWQRAAFAIGPGDRSAQLTGLSFDVVLRDILTPLTSGATLVLPRETEDAGSGGTLAWLDRERITLLHAVPSLAATWLRQANPGIALRTMRWVFFAGEPLTASLVARWRSAFPEGGRLANLYGPTETTLAKCCFVVPAPALAGVQPIGRPLPGAQALIVGPGDRLCGVGEPGEIVIRTPYRSHGYLDNPREQLARFATNPARENRGDVVYRTGDRGRYRADGSLDILGRLDDEVKIRGVRVAPAEVAAAIARQPGVGEVAVVGSADSAGAKSLAAYVVPAAGTFFSLAALRSELVRTLPPALVPARFAVLDRLPLSANGKVDRAALPPADGQPPRLERVAPRTDLERAMAEEWGAVLGVPDAGIDDDFFALGGHSLLAAQLLARLGSRFGVQLPLRAIFDRPTIRTLVAVVEDPSSHG